jgi:hypothetical protein
LCDGWQGYDLWILLVSGVWNFNWRNINFFDKSIESVSSKKSKQTWKKLIQKIFDVDPFICPKCQSEMKVIAVITDYDEIQKILSYLKKNKSPPFDKQTTKELIA